MDNARTIVAIALLAVFGAAPAMAADPALACRAAKTRTAGDYVACREKALSAALRKNLTADYSKCDTKFSDKWSKAEEDAAGACPDGVTMTSQMENFLTGLATEVADIVAGTTSFPGCGDGDVNAALEHCDGADLDGQSCADFGLFGSLACTAGCQLDASGCSRCPASALEFANGCWFLGAPAQGCAAVCAAQGLAYDDATSLVSGSSGSDANCEALLDAFDTPGGALDNAGGDCGDYGLGCAVNVTEMGVFRARCGTPATNAADGFPPIQRICACE